MGRWGKIGTSTSVSAGLRISFIFCHSTNRDKYDCAPLWQAARLPLAGCAIAGLRISPNQILYQGLSLSKTQNACKH